MPKPEAGRMNLVLAPGFMLDHDLWVNIEHRLQEIGQLSYSDLSRDVSIEAMAQRLLDDAPDRFLLIGFSMGGYVAREAVRRAPHRVVALVLIATSSRAGSDNRNDRTMTIPGASNVSKFAGLSRSAIMHSLAADHRDDEMIARIRAMGERLGGNVFQRQSNLVRASDTDRLTEIGCPTLIVAATEDQLRSLDEAQEIHRGIRQSTLVIIVGSGHMIPLEAPDELSHVIVEWFGGLPGLPHSERSQGQIGAE